MAERLSHAPRAVAVVLPEVCPEVFRAGEGGASDEAVPGVGRATVVAADLHGADDRSDEALSRRETLQAEAWRRNEYLGHQLVERSVRQRHWPDVGYDPTRVDSLAGMRDENVERPLDRRLEPRRPEDGVVERA